MDLDSSDKHIITKAEGKQKKNTKYKIKRDNVFPPMVLWFFFYYLDVYHRRMTSIAKCYSKSCSEALKQKCVVNI